MDTSTSWLYIVPQIDITQPFIHCFLLLQLRTQTPFMVSQLVTVDDPQSWFSTQINS